MSEILLLGNPSHRKSRKGKMPAALRRYWAKMRGKKARRHHHHAAATNSRKRRRNPAFRHHHRRRHRNPSFKSVTSGLMAQVMAGAWGALGGLGTDLAYGYTNSYLPAQMTSGYMLYATKVLYAALVAAVAGATMKKEGHAIGVGAMTVTLHDAAKSVLQQTMPTLQLGEYLSGPLGAVSIGPSVGNRNSSPMFMRRPLAATNVYPSVSGMGRMGEYLSDTEFRNGIPPA